MRIIARQTLKRFWERAAYADAEQPLRAWFREASESDWKNPAQIKAKYQSASVIGDDRVVFNIGGNKYRLVVRINFPFRVVYIRFIGIHRQYDRINAREI